MEMFTFSAGEAFMIRDGKIAELVRPVKLTGNLFTTLKNIDAHGTRPGLQPGRRLRQGRADAAAGLATGRPHIRIQDCVVGER